MKQATSQLERFQSQINNIGKGIKSQLMGAMAGLGAGFAIKGGVEDAMKYEALMTTLGESMGESRNDFMKWQEGVGASMGFSKLQGAELANTLSLNFKKISSSSEDLMKRTTKFMEMAAVISNKRGMLMSEVSDRIRSAMNQEADGADELGVNVRVAAIEQSKAYQEMANGQPWDKLNENIRKTILYHHILDSVSQNLGSTLEDTTALRMQQFTSSLYDVRLALGQAFLPILYQVLPYLTAMARALERVFQWISSFSRALFGGFKVGNKVTDQYKSQSEAITGVGDATEEAGKKAKKAGKDAKRGVAGFDEVHLLQEPSAGADGGGGGGGGKGGAVAQPEEPGLGLFGITDDMYKEISKKMQKFADDIKSFFKPIVKVAKAAYEAIADLVKDTIKEIIKIWDKHGSDLMKGFQNVWNAIKPIVKFVISFVWEAIKGMVEGVVTIIEGIIKFLGGVFTGNWKKAFYGLADIVIGALQVAWNFFSLTFVGGIRKALVSLIDDGAKLFIKLANGFKKPLLESFSAVLNGIKGFINGTKQFFNDFGSWMYQRGVTFAQNFLDAFSRVSGGIKNIFSTVKEFIVRYAVNPIINGFDNIKAGFSEGLTGGFKAVWNVAADAINRILTLFNTAIQKIDKAILPGDAIPTITYRVPRLAKGGITSGPTLAMVGDNPGGREVISPLDQLQGMLVEAVRMANQFDGRQGGVGGDIVLNLDGRQFARIVKPHLERENQRVGYKVNLNSI